MELSFYVVWNIFVTLVIAPLFYSIRKNENEAKRIDILMNKTREEIARDYVTRSAHNVEYSRLMDKIDKLDAPPASSFIQPRVEEIVSPISRGRTRQLPQPGLFNLV